MASQQDWHIAMEQAVEAVIDDTAVADVLCTGSPEPILERAA